MVLADWSLWAAAGFVSAAVAICVVLILVVSSLLATSDPRWWR